MDVINERQAFCVAQREQIFDAVDVIVVLERDQLPRAKAEPREALPQTDQRGELAPSRATAVQRKLFGADELGDLVRA
jgi:hypothetical protein